MLARMLPLLLALTAPAFAGEEEHIHNVPSEHPTIQEAVDSAGDGDIIEVAGGTYPEAVVITGKNDLLIRGKGKVVIDPPTETGVTIDSCDGVTIEKIRVVGAAPFGFLLVDSTGCTLFKCRVEIASADGVRVDGGSGHRFEKCTVKAAGLDGFGLGADELTSTDACFLTKCKVLQPGDDGVDVNGDGNTIEDCFTQKPLGEGYEIDDSTVSNGNTFTRCKVVKPGGDGFVVTGTSNNLVDCKAIQPGDDGAQVDSGSGHTISGCKFVKAAFDGIFEVAGITGDIFEDNKITAPQNDDGIDVQGDEATVTGNKVSKAGDNGYEIQGDDGEYTGNKSSGAKDDGFDLGGTGNTLSTNKASGSKGFDLFNPSPKDNEVLDDNTFKTEGP